MFYILYVLLGMFVGIYFGHSAGVKNGLEKGYKSAIFYEEKSKNEGKIE